MIFEPDQKSLTLQPTSDSLYMLMKYSFTILLLIFLNPNLWAQSCPTIPTDMDKRLRGHINFLADDKLEGREAGSRGEKLALDYMNLEFLGLGLLPVTNSGNYGQPFPFYGDVTIDPESKLLAGNRTFKVGKDFYPLQQSANGSLTNKALVDVGFGIDDAELEHQDYKEDMEYKGKVFLMNFSSPDGVHPHSKFLKYHDLAGRVELAAQKGATGVIVYNPDDFLEDPRESFKQIQDHGIPVIFIIRKHQEFFLKLPEIQRLNVEMKMTKKTGYNVAAFMNNEAEHTIIIGAHYDHLGWGHEGSLHREGPAAIHNGADDNASGTAAMIEIARYLRNNGPTNNNYLFIGFSGEEKGLYGSKYFAENSPIDLKKVNYMINMDMVGRMKDQSLVINGVGTSPVWKEILPKIDCYGIKTKTTESGVGPSDHTSFYLKDIPVLHFFTGAHEDYHKPSDDADKVNYKGIGEVSGYIISLIQRLDDKGKIEFTPTKQDNNENRPRFSVTLGVMPDYVFPGPGLKLDGVSEGKPAQKAGIQKGDIILQLGELKIADVMGYMKALSMFKKGDKTTAIIKRGEEEIEIKVEF